MLPAQVRDLTKTQSWGLAPAWEHELSTDCSSGEAAALEVACTSTACGAKGCTSVYCRDKGQRRAPGHAESCQEEQELSSKPVCRVPLETGENQNEVYTHHQLPREPSLVQTGARKAVYHLPLPSCICSPGLEGSVAAAACPVPTTCKLLWFGEGKL